MTQTLTAVPTAKPATFNPRLRLNGAADSPKESAPRATDSPKESVPSAKTLPPPKAANPQPKGEAPARAPDPPIDQLLALYLDPELTIADIAFSLGVSITRALLLFRGEDFLKLCEAHAKEHEKRAEYLARCNTDTATRTLVRIAESCEKPETARKAAGAIARMHPASRPSAPAKAPGKEPAAAPPASEGMSRPSHPTPHLNTNARSNTTEGKSTPPDPKPDPQVGAAAAA